MVDASGVPDEFPPRSVLWPGSVLGAIAHAVFVARAPYLAHEQSWDGRNYNVQDSQGSRGTIAFGADNNVFVGVFYYEPSQRNPLRRRIQNSNEAITPILNVPVELRALAQEALQYVMQEVEGSPMPVITSAFWSDLAGPRASASEPWPDVITNGASLINNQLLDPEAALRLWARDFELSDSEIAIVETVFRRRLAVTSGPTRLTAAEAQQISRNADGEEGLTACRESMGELGINFG